MSLKAKNLAPPMSFDFISLALLNDGEELFKFFSEFLILIIFLSIIKN